MLLLDTIGYGEIMLLMTMSCQMPRITLINTLSQAHTTSHCWLRQKE